MCRRYSFVASLEKLQMQLPFLQVEGSLRISYNISAGQSAYVVANDRPEQLQYLTWGLIPAWSNDGRNTGKLINARKEGIAASTSFRLPVRNKRCLVLADSYYLWKKTGTHQIPYRVLPANGDLMMFAGVWDEWISGDYAIRSFSILTSPANEDVAALDDRMPIILDRLDKQLDWLKEKPLDQVLDQLVCSAPGFLKAYPISEKIRSKEIDTLDLHQELPEG